MFGPKAAVKGSVSGLPEAVGLDASTIVIRIKGSDLTAFHAGKLTREDVLKRVEVKEL